jgi:hypothetical protein
LPISGFAVGSSCATEPGELARFKDGQERMQTINLVNVAHQVCPNHVFRWRHTRHRNCAINNVVFTLVQIVGNHLQESTLTYDVVETKKESGKQERTLSQTLPSINLRSLT